MGNKNSNSKRNTILCSEQKIALLEKYMEKQPSAAEIISFLSIVDLQPSQDILHVYNGLPQDVREKLAAQQFLDVVSWLRDYDRVDNDEKNRLIDIVQAAQHKDIGVEVLDRDLRSGNLTMRIEDNVFIIRVGNINYTYTTLGEKKMEIDGVEAVYLSSYKEWLEEKMGLKVCDN